MSLMSFNDDNEWRIEVRGGGGVIDFGFKKTKQQEKKQAERENSEFSFGFSFLSLLFRFSYFFSKSNFGLQRLV